MGYSNYKTLKKVVEKFGIKVKRKVLFEQVTPVPPSDWLQMTLSIASAIPLSNEKVKSERIISPILSEVHQRYKDQLTLFSGEELNVRPEDDLNGACDFFFSAVPDAYLLEAPIVSFTEANPDSYRGEGLDYKIAQCTAQMIAAQLFNQQSKKPIATTIWGCATTAVEWKFLQLEKETLYIDDNSYSMLKPEELLGVFDRIFK